MMLALVVLMMMLLVPRSATHIAVVVRNGFEFHASLTSPSVDWILVADNVRDHHTAAGFMATCISQLLIARTCMAAAAKHPLPGL